MKQFISRYPFWVFCFFFTINIIQAQDIAFVETNSIMAGNADPVPGCTAVTNLQNAQSSKNSLKFRWQHYPTISTQSYYYELYLSSNLTSPVKTGNIPPPACASAGCLVEATINGLIPATKYTLVVKRICGPNLESDTNSITAETLPNSGCITPKNVGVGIGNNSLSVTISPDSLNTPMSYTILVKQGTNVVTSKVVTVSSTSVVTPITGLNSCSDYLVVVSPDCGANSWLQQFAVTTTCCGQINNLNVSDETTNGFKINWKNPTQYPTENFTVQIKDLQNTILKEIVVPYSSGVLNNGTNLLDFALQINNTNFPAIQAGKEYRIDVVPYCLCYNGTVASACASNPGMVSTNAITNPPCATPNDVVITNVTDNSIAVSFLPPLSSLTNLLKKKFLVSIFEGTNTTAVASTWIGPNGNLTTTVYYQFDNLKENTNYTIKVTPYCCTTVNPVSQECIWEVGTIKQITQKTTLEPCKSPQNVAISNVTYNSATIQWTNTLTSNDRIRVELLQSAYVMRTEYVNVNGLTQSFTFTGLSASTEYIIRLTSECCQGTNGCSSYLSGGIVNKSLTTDAETAVECTQNPVTFNFVPMGDKLKVEWTPSTVQLSSSGERFLFYGPNGVTVIDNSSNNIISGFTVGNTYNVKIRRVFDGTEQNYTKACAWVEKEVTFDAPCDADANAIVKCLGVKSLLIELDKPLANGMKLKARFRDATEKLLQNANIDAANYCTNTTFSNIPINTAVTQSLATVWQTQILTANPQGKYVISGLKDCSLYEVQISIESNSNGINSVCKTITFPSYFHTLGDIAPTSTFTDVNENGLDDACEGFTAPPPPNNNTPNNLLKLVCGKDEPTTPINGVPYEAGKIGDVFVINGFPFEITDIKKNPGSKNVYSGTGIASIPVADQNLLLEFSSITVIDGPLKTVTAGTVKSQKDPTNAVDLVKVISQINSNNNDPNAQFCGEPSDGGEDEFGFNKGGKYIKKPPYDGYSDGDPYDSNFTPSGFDKNGNFMGDPNKKYDDCGCNAKGESEPGSGKACQKGCKPPYYWVAEKAETTEGIKLYALKKDKLKADVIKILDGRAQSNTTNLTAATTKCNGYRTTMETTCADLKYAPAMILGPNKEWVKQGMSKYFDKAPLPFKTNMDRDAKHVVLEQTHIQLYYCDIDETKFTNIDKLIKKLKDNTTLDAYLTSLSFQIKSMENELAKKRIDEHNKGDFNNFIAWLAERIDSKIEYDLKYTKITDAPNYDKFDLSPKNKDRDWERSTEGITDVPVLQMPLTKKPKFTLADIGQMAAKDADVMELFKIYHNEPEKLLASVEENLRFEYEQGYHTIGGVSRAYILEAVHQKRMMMLTGTNDAVGTPLSKSKTGTSKTQNVYFDNIEFTPNGTTVDIYVIVNFKGKQQVFQVLKAPLSASGFKTPIKLALGSDFSFPINNVARFTLKGQPNPALSGNGTPTTAISSPNGPQSPTSGEDGTYVVVGCDGFGGLNLDVKIEFCRKYFVPLDVNGIELADPAKVEATFKVKVLEFDNIVIDKLSVSKFALAKHKDFQFSLENVVLDFSDTETPSTVKFPGNYITAFANQTNGANNKIVFTPTPEWKGFYIGKISIKLPQKWSKKGEPAKEAFATNFIIDDAGISGECGVTNLITNGNMAGWKFTIDKFTLDVFHNKPIGAGMEGKIHLPILKEGENFEYTAAMLPGNGYQFSVKPPKAGLKVDLWLADVTFLQGTVVDITYVNDDFKASATLAGKINVNSGEVIKMDNFTFQDLVISTDQAVRNPGKWGIPDIGAHVKGFSLTIKDIQLNKTEVNGVTKTKLNVTTEIMLAESGSEALKLNAAGNFDILGVVNINAAGEQEWKYDNIQLNSFKIGMETNGFLLNGQLTFYREDPTYGEGFYGGITLKIKKPNTLIAVAAVFGKKESTKTPGTKFKYFFLDAFVQLPKAIPLGPLGLTGLGGGVSWHMKKQDPSNLDLSKASKGETEGDGVTPKVPTMAAPKSLTGAIYTPDENISIGLKLMVSFQLAETPRALNGGAYFEIVFKSNGGLSTIELGGVAHMMAEPLKVPDFTLNTTNVPEGIHAGLKLKYDFDNDIFTAHLDAFMNIEGSIKGCGSPGVGLEKCSKAFLGAIDMYFNVPEHKWYIKIGRTDAEGKNRIGLGVIVNTSTYIIGTAYFNIGNFDIKPIPPLPDYAQALFKNGSLSLNDPAMDRNSGKGFAFGADLTFKFGFNAFVYADFDFNLGFDMSLMQLPGVTCSNMGNKPIGINGWYANGQIYTRLIGDVGLQIKKKKISLGKLTLAAAMKGGGPKPFWAVGAASISYNVCCGLVKGTKQVNFEVGQQCKMVSTVGGSSSSEEGGLIKSITPAPNTSKVALGVVPTIEFEGPVDFPVSDEDGGKVILKVNKVDLLVGSQIVNCQVTKLKLGAQNFIALSIAPIGLLPEDQDVTLKVEAALYDYQSNGQLGELITEDKRSIVFHTELLNNIPESNVVASYPLDGMVNYYLGENVASKGYVYLDKEQNSLFNKGKTQVVNFYTNSSNTPVATSSFTYNSADKKISFDIPSKSFVKERVYQMVIALKESGKPDQELLTRYFRVSKYNTLYDKLKNVNLTYNSATKTVEMSAIDEPLDQYELNDKGTGGGTGVTTGRRSSTTTSSNGMLAVNIADNNTWINSVTTSINNKRGKQEVLYTANNGKQLTYTYQLFNNLSIGSFAPIGSTKGVELINKAHFMLGKALPTSNTYGFTFTNYNATPYIHFEDELSPYTNTKSIKMGSYCTSITTDNDEQADCSNNTIEAANSLKNKLKGEIKFSPKPTTTFFNIKYTLPSDSTPSSKVDKSCQTGN